jgi:hypothetical protein
MRKGSRLVWFALFAAAVASAAWRQAAVVNATPANSGFTTTFILKGATFAEFAALNQSPGNTLPIGNDDNVWLGFQKAIGRSDLYIVSNTWKPVNFDGNNGIASTGWHTHPAHTLIVVTAGTLTEYDNDCIRRDHTTGDTFVDPGGDHHAHIIRNEGFVAASTTAVQLVPYDPAKANRRVDVSAPENCTSIQ